MKQPDGFYNIEGVKHGRKTVKVAAKKRKGFGPGGACGTGRNIPAGNV
jgi:hypothetical protein